MGSAEGRLTGPAGSLILAAAYGAGLLTGLARFPDPCVVAIASLAVIIALRHLPTRAIACIVLFGVTVGGLARHRAARTCAARLPHDVTSLVVTLVDPGLASGRVRIDSLDCHGTVMAQWPEGRALPAGITAHVSARWNNRSGPLGRPDGTLDVRRIDTVRGSPGPIAWSRNLMADRIGVLFGPRAPLVDALLVGRRDGLDADLRQQFGQAGLIHLLVISGFHVGLVAGWIVLLLAAAGLPRTWGLRVGAVVALGYAGWLGWPAPATRASALLCVAALSRWRQRRWRPDGTLGLALVVVLAVDPWAITRVGAWLSFVALGGVVWATRWAKRWWPGLGPPGEALVASVGATLTTAPLGALVFGQVAPIGILLNLAAMPLTAVMVPALAGAVLLLPVLPAMAHALAASSGLLMDALIRLGVWGSTLPGAGIPGEPGLRVAVPWLAILLVIHLATRDRTIPRESARRMAWVLALGAFVTAVHPVGGAPSGPTELEITFLAVGQGDAAVLRTPHGHWIVIDAGPQDEQYDAGKRVVVPYLVSHRARAVDLLVLSHGHRDHAGGVPALLRAMPVGLILDPAEPAGEESYRAFLHAVVDAGVPWRVGRAGEHFALDGVELRVVHPTPGWPGAGTDLNEDSIVLEVRFGAFTALLAGDAGIEAESTFVATLAGIDLLKVGHHGSRTATGSALLEATHPAVGVISLGINNYGHPAPETLARLAAAHVDVWRTDREGAVTLTTDGRTFRMRSRDRTAVFDAADP
ncbi:MAG TPA: DNA internalization-related competence protein ComEC/Rec2 [Gemmatimonadales bacterium]|nr:DNA internalization-related competence protein ComEC/Rec2 [Gemmatimonadales bacterium]